MRKTRIIFLLVFTNYIFVVSQSIVVSLEAENAELTLPSKVKQVSGYSGNAYVGDNDPGSAIVFRNVNVPAEGTYEFRTYYTSMHIRSITIKSGSYPQVICTAPTTTPDWDTPPVGEMVTYIYLNAGNNSITITPYGGAGGPNIDKFEIITTSVSMPRPEPVKFSYDYDLTDNAVVTTNKTTGNLVHLTDNDESTVYSYSGSSVEIKIECDLPYLLTGYFLSAGPEGSQNVKNWKMEYSTNGSTYAVVTPTKADDVENGILFHIGRNPHSDKSSVAQYYRLTAYGGEIGEIQLFGIPYLPNSDNKNFPVDMTDGIDVRTKSLGDPLGVYQYGSFDERYYNLFDRDMSKKYYWHSASSFWVEVELDQLATLGYYTLTSCQDYPERDPKSWVVEGFDRDWEIINEISGFEFPTRYATMKFYIQNKKQYRGYRLRVLQNNGANAFQLLKWQLFEDNTSSSSPVLEGAQSSIYSFEKEIIIKSEEKGEYQIFNLSGRLVASGKMNVQENKLSVDQGAYVVRLITAGRHRIEKVIVR